MATTRKFIKKNLTAEDLKWSNSEIIKGVSCWYVTHNDTGGYTENEVNFYLYADGTFMIDSDREGYSITLLPEQIELLRDILNGKD